jgi:enoyl-CoA hydratase/carnithine racemase
VSEDSPAVLYSVDDGVATITFNRPERMNAFARPMVHEVIAAFDRADADDAVRAIVVTGAGKAFSAGADLAGGKAFDRAAHRETNSAVNADGSFNYQSESARDGGGLLTLRIFRCLKPVIGAVNGVAAGMGSTMLLPMDFRLASETARFGFTFSRLGIVPESASAFFLPRIVGISRALEWCYSGRVFPAAEALESGLVSKVLPPDDLVPAAQALARDVSRAGAPVSIALIRQMMWRGLGMRDPMEAHRIDSRGILSRGRSADTKEGVAAFLEKRAPAFPDRVSADMPDYFPWWDEPRFGE